MHYSPSTNGFYIREIHGDNIPADAVEITVEEHQTLLEGQSNGKRIVADEDGFPTLQDPLPQEPVIPQQVTRAQGKVVLIQMGLWQPVLDYVAGIADPVQRALAEVALHETQFWQRSSPFLAQAAAALGMTDAQLDELFMQAEGVVL